MSPPRKLFAFIDATLRRICRPSVNQRNLYNAHKHVHSIKFKSVIFPNGLISNLYGPLENKRHDSSMLHYSGLLEQLQQHTQTPNGESVCFYGDPTYPLRIHLQALFRSNLNPLQGKFNSQMSKVQVSAEWLFNEIIKCFAILNFKKNG